MWLNDCATALVALVVLRSSMLFWKKISRKRPPTPAKIWMIVVATPVMNGTPRHSIFGRMGAEEPPQGTTSPRVGGRPPPGRERRHPPTGRRRRGQRRPHTNEKWATGHTPAIAKRASHWRTAG